MKFLNLVNFAAPGEALTANIGALGGFVVLIVAVNLLAIRLMARLAAPGDKPYFTQVGGFLVTGMFAGMVLALSTFGLHAIPALQGAFGGLLAALWIAFMVPKKLEPEPAPF